MTTRNPLNRVCELVIGPLAEEEGGGPRNQALVIRSTGGRDTLDVNFNIRKTMVGAPNSSTIEVYNLNSQNRARIRRTLTRVQLYVGYENTELNLIASGALMSVAHPKNGPDIVTTMTLLDGFGGMTRGVTNRSYGGQIPIANIVREIAADMPGVTIGRVDIDGTTANGGRVFAARAADALDKLAIQYGFSWSVQEGVFQAISDRRAFNRSLTISARTRTLEQVYPILAGPMQVENGVEIEAILDARVRPADTVTLESIHNPQYNGDWKVHAIDYSGGTGDGDGWDMKIQSFKVL